jgi:nicotinamide mononucleotide transporter
MLSIIAMILMAKKKIESWFLWIIADCIDIVLYFSKGVALVGIEYVLFLIIAIRGLIQWINDYKNQTISEKGKILSKIAESSA